MLIAGDNAVGIFLFIHTSNYGKFPPCWRKFSTCAQSPGSLQLSKRSCKLRAWSAQVADLCQQEATNTLLLTMKRFFLIIFLYLVTIVPLSCYMLVSINARGKTFNDVQDIPYNKAGLLLGTSPITSKGEHNYYFDERIRAAATLYHNGKIKRIIASGGDYSSNGGYNELIAMRDSLIRLGVPDSLISLDYSGTRTLHSIFRVKDLENITIISQKYHNERAIYLAEHYGLEAVAYNATIPDILKKKIRNISREFLARVKLFIDFMGFEE